MGLISRWIGAVRGGLGFLTRLPVGYRDGDWTAFRTTPAAFPVVGLVAGVLAALPLLAVETLGGPTVALGYLLSVYAVTGIHHLDGIADLGDASVVHGDIDRRREVLKDTTTGVGALLAVAIAIVALALGGLGLAGLSVRVAVGVAIGAETGTKLGMAAMACFGRAAYDGMGKGFTDASAPGSFLSPLAIAVAAAAGVGAALARPLPVAVALAGAVAGIGLPWYWADRNLGGINGDIFGAANEIGRVAGVHLGVIAWTLS
ncbi:adenosylcobinamide-GDP ribazoletransferase [Natrinema saccharevitans]|uniref:Adenosylcobinamide-GDP ribazoletransferase n=1 Tax=Natrinema saccharevitans TaxID=301967 RepID=A0A1S8AU56_9EURY|nr:adenosylcobinamide-GDP ribazoletransferase [Natrinema saccharevitans]OLZ40250.1 adenosylcobinamide-GDP ribazoletransferase [Natrinema saccharevitans]